MSGLGAFLIGIFGSLITSFFTSVVAPRMNRNLEKEKTRDENRRKLIEKCRNFLSTEPNREDFARSDCYSSLREFFSEGTRKCVEETRTIVCADKDGHRGRHSGVNPYATKVRDNLAKLEREWELL